MWFKSSKISNCVTKCVENHWHYRWGKKKARRKVTIKKVSSVTASNISAFYLNFISFLVPTPPDIHERLILPHFYFIHTKKKLNVDESVSLGNGYKEVSYLTIRKGHIVWDEKKKDERNLISRMSGASILILPDFKGFIRNVMCMSLHLYCTRKQ